MSPMRHAWHIDDSWMQSAILEAERARGSTGDNPASGWKRWLWCTPSTGRG
jgi:hypothetical protein